MAWVGEWMVFVMSRFFRKQKLLHFLFFADLKSSLVTKPDKKIQLEVKSTQYDLWVVVKVKLGLSSWLAVLCMAYGTDSASFYEE